MILDVNIVESIKRKNLIEKMNRISTVRGRIWTKILEGRGGSHAPGKNSQRE
jgi:hypothetical protein